MASEAYLAVTMSNGLVTHYAFQLEGRGFAPGFEGWSLPDATGKQIRLALPELIEFTLRQMERDQWNTDKRDTAGNVVEPATQIVSWRFITDSEHEMLTRDRPGVGSVYRAAIVDRNGALEYDLPKARECARKQIRRDRSAKFDALDAAWMQAVGQKDKTREEEVEAERQKWRDAPTDPRIDAAQTLDELKAIKVE